MECPVIKIRCSACGFGWQVKQQSRRHIVYVPAGYQCPYCWKWTGEPVPPEETGSDLNNPKGLPPYYPVRILR